MAKLDQPGPEAIRIEGILAALDHPVRLRVVRALADREEMSCQDVLPDVSKSSASHHFRVLRENGVVEQHQEGRYVYLSLRRNEIDGRFPGVLEAVIRG